MIKVNGGKKEIRENMELMEKGKTKENNDNSEYYKCRKFSEECIWKIWKQAWAELCQAKHSLS